MIERILLVTGGSLAGLVVSVVCALAGLQVRYLNLFITINCISAVGGAVAGVEVVSRYRKATQRRAIAPDEIDRAIGAISERYALSPDRQQVLIALQEFKAEVSDDRR